MSRFVVTANYLDRSDKVNRWFVRREDEPLSKVQKVSALVANGVKFVSSHGGYPEGNFGCTALGLCDSVEFVESAPQLTYDVRFDHVFIACSRALKAVDKLSLASNGVISADGIVIDDTDKWNYTTNDYID